jgi:hypothetical protein
MLGVGFTLPVLIAFMLSNVEVVEGFAQLIFIR